MTAEIGILNRVGLALAADSTVTIAARKPFLSGRAVLRHYIPGYIPPQQPSVTGDHTFATEVDLPQAKAALDELIAKVDILQTALRR